MAESITLRAVERFPEPLFTELVRRLLHDRDRRAVIERYLPAPQVAPAGTTGQQVRIGAYAGDTLVGWSQGTLNPGGVLYVASSAVIPEFRRKGLYSRLTAAIESEAIRLGCLRIESHNQAVNSAVLIAKLRAGYVVVGTEFTAEMGLLLKLAKALDPSRQTLFEARAGTLEAAMRYFDTNGMS